MLLKVNLDNSIFEQKFYVIQENGEERLQAVVPISDLGLYTINMGIQEGVEKIIISGHEDLQYSMVRDIKNAKNLFLYQPLKCDLVVKTDFEEITIPFQEVTEEDILKMIQERNGLLEEKQEENEMEEVNSEQYGYLL